MTLKTLELILEAVKLGSETIHELQQEWGENHPVSLEWLKSLPIKRLTPKEKDKDGSKGLYESDSKPDRDATG